MKPPRRRFTRLFASEGPMIAEKLFAIHASE
jgi:hypothetical protein